MWVLGFDTSSPETEAALVNTESKRLYLASLQNATHERGILELLGSLLKEASIAYSDLGSIVIGTGPGSFTGLRIGASVALGLSSALGITLSGVTTHFAYAAARVSGSSMSSEGTAIIVITDARKNSFFVSSFIEQEGSLGLVDSESLRHDTLMDSSAFEELLERFQTEYKEKVIVTGPACLRPSMESVKASSGLAAVIMEQQNRPDEISGLELHYGSALRARSLKERRGW